MSGNQSTLIGASGGVLPTGLINGSSGMTGRSTVAGPNMFSFYLSDTNAKVVDSASTTAATLKTILSLSGRGAISLLALCNRSIATTHRLKVTLDGVVIFDATSPVTTAGEARAYCVIGDIVDINSCAVIFEPLLFENSLLIEYASSVTNTACAQIAYRYTPR